MPVPQETVIEKTKKSYIQPYYEKATNMKPFSIFVSSSQSHTPSFTWYFLSHRILVTGDGLNGVVVPIYLLILESYRGCYRPVSSNIS